MSLFMSGHGGSESAEGFPASHYLYLEHQSSFAGALWLFGYVPGPSPSAPRQGEGLHLRSAKNKASTVAQQKETVPQDEKET